MQRSLFLLTGMARLLGQWQLALPGSLPAARQLAASFLALAAQARLGERLAFHCPPVDPKEKASGHHEPCMRTQQKDPRASRVLAQDLCEWGRDAGKAGHGAAGRRGLGKCVLCRQQAGIVAQ